MEEDGAAETSISARGVGEKVRCRPRQAARKNRDFCCDLQRTFRRCICAPSGVDIFHFGGDLITHAQVLEFFWNLASLDEVSLHIHDETAFPTLCAK